MFFIFVWHIQNISQISFEYVYYKFTVYLLPSNRIDSYDGQQTISPELLRTVIQITCRFKNGIEYTISFKISDNVNILLQTHFVRPGHSK